MARINSTAESTGGKIAGIVTALCISAVMVMGTIKIGLIWFG